MNAILYETVTLGDFLTDAEIKKARRLFKQARSAGENVNALLVSEIIKPNIDRINEKLNRQNDERYLAYAVEYVLMRELHPKTVEPTRPTRWKPNPLRRRTT